MGSYQDIAVGTVSTLLGIFLLLAAGSEWRWFYTLASARLLERCVGRRGARCVHALLGLGLIILGLAIVQGYRFPLFNR